MLKFESKVYTTPTNFAENRPQIGLGRSLINIKSNLINSGTQIDTNNLITSQNILFSIPTFTEPPNYKIIEALSKPEYMSIVSSKILWVNVIDCTILKVRKLLLNYILSRFKCFEL